MICCCALPFDAEMQYGTVFILQQVIYFLQGKISDVFVVDRNYFIAFSNSGDVAWRIFLHPATE